MANTPPRNTVWDPVFIHSRREALIILGIWIVALLWAVPFCYWKGYGGNSLIPADTIFGVPSWAFWGIAVPWLTANVFTVWFCLYYMHDDPLDLVHEDGENRI